MKSSAKIAWDTDVKVETDRLIRKGVPPWQAALKAVENVSRNRKERVTKNLNEK